MLNNLQLQQKAAAFRNEHGMGACEPIRLKSWLPRLGVVALFKELSDGFSGMAIKQGSYRFMIINCEHRISKQHFTVAHELYHLFIQENFVTEISNSGRFSKADRVEWEADWFATYLLMPEDCLISLIPQDELSKNKVSLGTIVKIEQYFACSRIAVLRRLDSIKLIDYKAYEHHTQNVAQSALMLGYDSSLYQKGNKGVVIGDYGHKAKDLFDKGKISESHYKSLMLDLGFDLENANTEDGEE